MSGDEASVYYETFFATDHVVEIDERTEETLKSSKKTYQQFLDNCKKVILLDKLITILDNIKEN